MHLELLYKNCIHIFVYDICKIVLTQTQFVLQNPSGNVSYNGNKKLTTISDTKFCNK